MSPAPSSAPADDEKIGPGRIVAAIIFALFAIAFFVAASIYLTTPAHSLPSFMGYARTRSTHRLYAVGTFLIGLAFVVAAWFALRYRSLALEEAREAERAAEAAPQAAVSPEPEEDADPLDDTHPMNATHP